MVMMMTLSQRELQQLMMGQRLKLMQGRRMELWKSRRILKPNTTWMIMMMRMVSSM